jgi:phosphotransferase system  glucose/maltose/N-acetylglucosamine-specific IIC component
MGNCRFQPEGYCLPLPADQQDNASVGAVQGLPDILRTGNPGIVDGENRVLLIAIAVVLFAVSFAVAWFLKKKADLE